MTTLFMAFSIFETCWFLMNGFSVFLHRRTAENLKGQSDSRPVLSCLNCSIIGLGSGGKTTRCFSHSNSLCCASVHCESHCLLSSRCFSKKNPMIIRTDLLLSILLKKRVVANCFSALAAILPIGAEMQPFIPKDRNGSQVQFV